MSNNSWKTSFAMSALLLIIGTLTTLWIFHSTSVEAEEFHDPLELPPGCSNLWLKNITIAYKKWHDDCEISNNIKITSESTIEHILPVYDCILPHLSNHMGSYQMPIVDTIKMNVATDIGGKEDWRYHIVDDIFATCFTKEQMSEFEHMSTKEFVEHNQCYWRVIDGRCHHDTHQKI